MLLIIDNGSNFIHNYEKKLIAQKINFTVIPYYNTKAYYSIKSKIKGIIFSGGPGIPLNSLNLELDFIALKELNIPMIGFCLGAEAISSFYKGQIKPLKNKQLKDEIIRIKKTIDPIFNGLPNPIKLKKNHTHQMASLPTNFEIIASSKICPIEVMKHKHKPIYAFQSHPEDSGEDGRIIMNNFLKICKIIN